MRPAAGAACKPWHGVNAPDLILLGRNYLFQKCYCHCVAGIRPPPEFCLLFPSSYFPGSFLTVFLKILLRLLYTLALDTIIAKAAKHIEQD